MSLKGTMPCGRLLILMLALGRSDKNAAQVAEVADIALEDQQAARNVPALSGEADARVVQCDCSARDGTSTSTSNADTEPRYHDCSLFPPMPVRHVVSFRVKDEVGEAGRALLLDTMRAMLE